MSAENQTVPESSETPTHVNSDASAIVIGTSPQMKKVWDQVAQVAPTKTTVLITGETGVGKEEIAKKIHERSPRKNRDFEAVNCGAFSQELLHSELFGHEKGAFTGAISQRRGIFERANGSTLLLDEVGEMPPEVQVKFLRVLQEQKFTRLGGVQIIEVDVRIIAATNVDLKASVQQKKFRPDLYYRLNLFPIAIPRLRDRKDEIAALVDTFICDFNEKHEKKITGITPDALKCLEDRDWPGNVRELRNCIERSFIQRVEKQPGELKLEDILKVLEPENPMDVRVPSGDTDKNLKEARRAFDEVMNVLKKWKDPKDSPLLYLKDAASWTDERLKSFAIYYLILKKPGTTIADLVRASGAKRDTYNTHQRGFKKIDETSLNNVFDRIKEAVDHSQNSTGEEKRNTHASPDTEARFAALEARFAALEARFAALEAR